MGWPDGAGDGRPSSPSPASSSSSPLLERLFRPCFVLCPGGTGLDGAKKERTIHYYVIRLVKLLPLLSIAALVLLMLWFVSIANNGASDLFAPSDRHEIQWNKKQAKPELSAMGLGRSVNWTHFSGLRSRATVRPPATTTPPTLSETLGANITDQAVSLMWRVCSHSHGTRWHRIALTRRCSFFTALAPPPPPPQASIPKAGAGAGSDTDSPIAAAHEQAQNVRSKVQQRRRNNARGLNFLCDDFNRPPPGVPIMLLHFSKAGGTSMCRLAGAAGKRVHPDANNCWINGMGPVWFSNMRHIPRTCDAYLEIFNKEHVDFLANEAYLDAFPTKRTRKETSGGGDGADASVRKPPQPDGIALNQGTGAGTTAGAAHSQEAGNNQGAQGGLGEARAGGGGNGAAAEGRLTPTGSSSSNSGGDGEDEGDEHEMGLTALPELCSRILYMTMVRAPAERVVSHMQQPGIVSKKEWDAFQNMSMEARLRHRPSVLNNYMVRFLLGREAYRLPFGNVTDAHMRAAAQLLAMVDVVLVLEDLPMSEAVMQSFLRWSDVDLDAHSARRAQHNYKMHDLTPAEQEAIQQANTHDQLLYELAQLLLALDRFAIAQCPHV